MAPMTEEQRWQRLEELILELLNRKLDVIITKINEQTRRQRIIMQDLTALEAAVAKDTTVDLSAITLITGLAQQIRDAAADPAAIQALADKLDVSANDLAAAVAANTPAAP